jgi:hypothetical protein
LAWACPNCGYPVAAGIRHAVEELTEEGPTRSARQQHAAAKLKTWSERYQHPPPPDPFKAADASFLDRHWRPILFIIVAIILILQLTWVFSMFQ